MIERKITHDGLLVLTKCSGKITPEELVDSTHWMINNYGDLIKPGFSQLFDALDADTAAISEDDIHRIAHINLNLGRNRGGFTMAILTVKPYPQALAKLHKLLSAAANIRVEIFSNIDAAYQWLAFKKPLVEKAFVEKAFVGKDWVG